MMFRCHKPTSTFKRRAFVLTKVGIVILGILLLICWPFSESFDDLRVMLGVELMILSVVCISVGLGFWLLYFAFIKAGTG